MHFNRLIAAALAGALSAAPALAQDAGNGADAAPAGDAAQPQEVTADSVVARIGETEITLGHVLAVRRQLPQQYAQLPDQTLMQAIVDQLVDQYLLARTRQGELPEIVRLRLENERRAMLATRAIEDIVADAVTEADIQAAYEARYVEAEAAQEYNASHILVETEDAAQEIVAELEGGADFATLAEERSTGPSAERGGELGWFGAGSMVPAFEDAVMAMEPGTVSAPVQTRFGWHVIRLNEVRDVPPPPLQEVRGELAEELRREIVQARLDELRAAADVQTRLDEVPAAAVRNDALLAD